MNATNALLSPGLEPAFGCAVAASVGADASGVLGFSRSLTFADLAFCSLPVAAFLAIVSLV